jgi:dihydrofolate synthase/folylpolyglutamate synthase
MDRALTPLDRQAERYAAAESYLYRRVNYERRTDDTPATELRLETMLRLLERRNHPQRKYPIIHVAGTKGKGSVVCMIASMLTAAGYRVGQYCSPHLESIRERVAVDRDLISNAEFSELIESFEPDIAELDRLAQRNSALHAPTFFEIVTAAAFEYFAQRRVDAAVIEVGMGGRLDSTNVCEPLLTMITTIGIDHQRQLGKSRALIAGEKAGIIKPGIPLICGVPGGRPAEVIAEVARSKGSPVYWLGRDYHCRVRRQAGQAHGECRFQTWGTIVSAYEFRDCRSALGGRHQAVNAAMAIAAVQWLNQNGWTIHPSAVVRGLEQVRLPGRFEVFGQRPPVVLDIAHNEISTAAFVRAMQDRFGPGRQSRTLIFSASRDKKISRMLARLLPHFHRVILTRIVGNPRGCDLPTLEALCRKALAQWNPDLGSPPLVSLAANSEQALSDALRGLPPPDCIAVTGSAFLIGEMMPVVRGWAASHPAIVDVGQPIEYIDGPHLSNLKKDG